MAVVDYVKIATQYLRDAGFENVFPHPMFPRGKKDNTPRNAIFMTPRGGLPSQPFLGRQGTYETAYFDLWVRGSSHEETRQRTLQAQNTLHLGALPDPVVSCFYVMHPIYQGHDPQDGHVFRAPMKINYHQDPEPLGPDSYTNPFYGISGGIARYDARTLDLADGEPVTSWGDVSGQADPLPALEGGAWMQHPVYSAVSRPGVSYGYYTGDRSGHSIPAALARDPRVGFSFVVLVDRVLDGGIRGLATWGVFRGSDTGRWGVSTFNSNSLRAYASGYMQSDSDIWSPGPAVVAWSSDTLGVRVYVDDVLVTSGPHPAGFVPRLDEPGVIGDNLGGTVHDILFFDHAISTAELATVSAGIAKSWGL